VFDPPTVAGQAVLSKAIAQALDHGFLDRIDWFYDDKELIAALMRWPDIKKRLQADFVNSLPRLCLLHVVREGLAQFDAVGRSGLVVLIEAFLATRLGGKARAYGHTFRDRGTFAKSVEFLDPDTGQRWCIDDSSDSLILYGFTKGRLRAEWDAERVGHEFREWIEPKL
jgi:hypothetical protein